MVKLGLKENWQQFTLLVIINGFVGGMIGMERTIFPQFAHDVFHIDSTTAILSFIVAFGLAKAFANYFTGRLANTYGRKNLLLFGWLIAIPIPFILMSAPNWGWVIAANVSALRSRGLDTVLRSLSEIGYDAEWHCIPASAVGAPHQRDRIWIVAYPQLHGFSTASVTRGIEETIRQKSQGSDNSLNFEGANRISTTNCNVANSNNSRGGTSECDSHPHRTQIVEGREVESLGRVSGCGETLADSNILGTQVPVEGQYPSQQVLRGSSEAWRAAVGDYWSVESGVGRVADGVSGRVDRIKQLGNAVVPQIPQIIGSAILSCNI